MEVTALNFLVVFLIFFVSFFIKGIAGFGDALIAGPALSMFMDNKVISPASLLLTLPLNGYVSWRNRKSFSVKELAPIAGFILLGVLPGTLLLKYADSWILKAGLGVLIIALGIEMITRNKNKEMKYNPVVLAFVCFCSGVTSGLYGINLFFVAYMARTSKSRGAFRGNLSFVFFVENVTRLITYIIGGVFTRDAVIIFLMAVPGMILGFWLGLKVDKKLSDRAIHLIVTGVFMLGGFSVFIKALFEMKKG